MELAEETNASSSHNVISSSVASTDCLELKNIMYKTMLMGASPLPETHSSHDLTHIEKYLEEEKNHNQTEPWGKLDKTRKMQKLQQYVERYQVEHGLTEEEATQMLRFLHDSLDRKKLLRVKEVIYDKTQGIIKDIPVMVHNKASKHFTLRHAEKRVSTLKNLPAKQS
jgi:hypothetical protein